MGKGLDEIKDMLAKLMAKEESAREMGNQAEAESFAAHIQRKLLEYELSIDDIRKKEPESVIIIQKDFDTDPLTNRHESNWAVYLYDACSRTNFCKVLLLGPASTTRIRIIGTEMNLEFLDFMINQLVVKIRTLSRKAFADYNGGEKRNTFIRGYLKGVCSGIKTKLALQRRLEEQTSSQIAGLVVQKDRAVNDYIEKTIGRLGTAKPTKLSGRDGYGTGLEHGKTMDISIKKDRGAGGTKLLN